MQASRLLKFISIPFNHLFKRSLFYRHHDHFIDFIGHVIGQAYDSLDF